MEYECNSTQKTTKNFTDIESYADSANFARRKKGTGTSVADPQLFYEDFFNISHSDWIRIP
jgi:hypothetical protein